MRTVFSSNETSQVMLVRDALERQGVAITTQNENSSLSPVPGFRPCAEIWVTHEEDFENARKIVAATLALLRNKAELPPWTCTHCHEENPPTFERCWNCGRDQD